MSDLVNLSAFKVPSGEITWLLVIIELLSVQPCVKSSEYVIKLVVCGSNNKLGHPFTTPSIKGYSSLGTLIAISSINPLLFTLVAVVALVKSKSPTPLSGSTL